MRSLDDADIEHWQRHGYVLVEDFLDPDELAAAQENIERYMPQWGEYVAHAPRYRQLVGNGNTPTTPQGWVLNGFPFVGDTLNQVTLHPYLLAFVQRLVGHDRLALSHAGLIGKYAGRGDYDQELHVDFSNNTLAFPGADLTYCDIPAIIYYTDVNQECGPTYVVSQQVTGQDIRGPRHRSKGKVPLVLRRRGAGHLPGRVGHHLLDADVPPWLCDAPGTGASMDSSSGLPHGRAAMARLGHVPAGGGVGRNGPFPGLGHPTPA